MPTEIGKIEAIYRYPVKSMRGQSIESANLGWHGIDGDRRLAFRRVEQRGPNPWLSAGRLADLISFAPVWEHGDQGQLPTHVRTPDGQELPLFSEALAEEVGRRHGAPVEMMQLGHGIFDEASISMIATSTVAEIGRLSGVPADVRRFRPNLLIRPTQDVAFIEDEWMGGTLTFGHADDATAVTITMRDLRCKMVNLDPDGARSTPEVMMACVRNNDNHAGVYATVTRTGPLSVGQAVVLHS